jgi:murein DD-endopeptidase MepM/ murein hydrolase activator NlpD
MIKQPLRFLLALGVLVAAGLFMARGEWPWQRLSDVSTAEPIVVRNPFRIVRDTLQRGETVSALLERQGVKGLNLTTLANALRFDPRRIQAGRIFMVHRDPATDQPTSVEFRPSADQRLRFIRTSSGEWTGEAIPIRWTHDTIRVSTVVEANSNLYDAMGNAVNRATLDQGEVVRLVNDLADVNEWTIDFSRDVQAGDPFTAVVERDISEEGEVKFGRILASEVGSGGKTYTAFNFVTSSGKNAFYDEKGNSTKRAFLLAPVAFRYISSGFSSARVHPILGLTRRHEGIDFAAAQGTDVRATGDGVVVHAGWGGGYGNLIEVRHSNGITTRYGHLVKIKPGIRVGSRVSQSEVIGWVGMTGLATGPHLHYEFRQDGVARNPRSVKSETGPPLDGAQRAAFEQNRVLLAALLGRHPAAGNAIAE